MCRVGTKRKILVKGQLIAVYDEQETHRKTDGTNGNLTDRNSPDSFEADVATQLAAFQPIGEIEVTPSALKLGFYIMVYSSSDLIFAFIFRVQVPGP
ncbi:hypothetical protein WISP_122977 [Willisornis vidua]|uniref:Uncharacterized protein n=1 Tax=Willisornis vidua TaxID=1566151 RepID=A0ABQ9CRY2_9PASS|nr:hypothetical protein WISP_122977 [Willisornis vidua]